MFIYSQTLNYKTGKKYKFIGDNFMINPRILKILDRTEAKVDLSNKGINDTEIKEIIDLINSNYRHIKDLNLAHNPITDIGAEDLVKLENVEKLDLTQTAINYKGVVNLLQSKIKNFIFDNCDFSEDILPYIEKAQKMGKIVHHSVCTHYNATSFGQ